MQVFEYIVLSFKEKNLIIYFPNIKFFGNQEIFWGAFRKLLSKATESFKVAKWTNQIEIQFHKGWKASLWEVF